VSRIGYWIAIALTAVGAAELVARLDDLWRYGTPFAAAPAEMHDMILIDSIGIRGRPHGQYRYRHLNAYGFRGPESPLVLPAGCVRVVTLGASETAGAQESPDMEYPAQLRRDLAPAGCYDVENAAIVGMSVHSILPFWTRWVSRFSPRVATIYANPAFYLNTVTPESLPPPFYPAPPAWMPRLVERAHLVFHWPEFVQRRRIAHWYAQDTKGHRSEWFFSQIPQVRMDEYLNDLDSLGTLICADGGLPILVTHARPFGAIPQAGDSDLLQAERRYAPRASLTTLLAFDDSAAEGVRQLGARRGWPVADAARRMSGHPELFTDFTHLTDSGSSVMASLIAATIVSARGRTCAAVRVARNGS
jgi:hypothetical protein